MSSVNELRARILDGDQAALGEILAEVQPLIYRFGMRMCRHTEDAEDVLQETMLEIAKGIDSYRGEGKLSTWAYAIARSFCIKKRRRRKGQPAPHEEQANEYQGLAAEAASPAQRLETKQTWQAVAAALDRLDDDNRAVLLLRDVEGLSAKDAADALGLSIPALKSRLHRARKALRDAFGAAQQGPNCPDIVTAFSQKLEGELNASACAEMEAHLEGCPVCQGICSTLREDLKLCQTAPAAEVPEALAARIRAAIAAMPGVFSRGSDGLLPR